MMRSPGFRKKRFTLAELLLIVAVLLIDAAILFPVIAGENDAARHIACEKNLKDLSVRLNGYSDDYGYMPPAWTGADRQVSELYGRNRGFWFDFLARGGYFTGWVEARNSRIHAKNNAEKAMRSLICPADDDPVLVNHTYSVYTSYGFNDMYGKNVASIVKVAAIANADRAPLVMDSWGGKAGAIPTHMRARVSSGYLQSGKYPAHGFNNTLFFDGHVESVRNRKIPFAITTKSNM